MFFIRKNGKYIVVAPLHKKLKTWKYSSWVFKIPFLSVLRKIYMMMFHSFLPCILLTC